MTGMTTRRVTTAGTIGAPGTWRNWGRNQVCRPKEIACPADTDGVANLIRRAARDGRRVRPIGSGHSFTPAALADDIQVRFDRLGRVISADPHSGLVRVGAGIPLHRLNTELEARGLSMTNLGDIDRQTLAGAISTGTHGTGSRFGGLASQIRALQLVTGQGDVVECSADRQPELFAAARVGLGAFGVITEVTLQCEPLFHLVSDEEPMPLAVVQERFDELVDGNDHFEFFWFPHTGMTMTERHNRCPVGTAPPLPRWRQVVEDEVLANGAFGAIQRAGRLAPATIPALNRVTTRALSARRYSDVSHRVLITPRRVRFREMEYAVPREHTLDLVRGIRDWIDRNGARISFPIEVRVAAADDIWLSTACGRPTGYVAVHQYYRREFEPYFRAVEAIARELSGRPHWGKLHWLGPAELRTRYPRFDDALAVRDQVDPDRTFSGEYTRQVFGE